MIAPLNQKALLTLLVGLVKTPSLITPVAVTSVTMDSRQLEQGALFIATAKTPEQRLTHIQQALEKGTKAILIDQNLPLSTAEMQCVASKVQVIPISHLDSKVSEIAGRFYGHPSLALTVIAVTGTNGKTSVSQFIAQCLEASGRPCGVIGTLGVGRLADLTESGMTTPDPVRVQSALAAFCHRSIKYVVLEASSHALAQNRLNSVAIDVAVLTNLSRDHLDYHQDMANYAAAKQRLFMMSSVKTAVINADDAFGQRLMATLVNDDKITVMTYGRQTENTTLSAHHIETSLAGLNFSLVNGTKVGQITSRVLGQFNIDNLLATAGGLVALKIPFVEVVDLLSQCVAINGRMQMLGNVNQVTVVIDFAHTPDALDKVLQSLREHLPKQGQLWCVFGCGGDRDTGKRALMGATAERYADCVVLTADNPRSEDNETIVAAILTGIQDNTTLHIEHDRKQAIAYAIDQAKAQDIVLVAGKGHEHYQEIAGVKHPFSDFTVVTQALAAANDAHLLSLGVQK